MEHTILQCISYSIDSRSALVFDTPSVYNRSSATGEIYPSHEERTSRNYFVVAVISLILCFWQSKWYPLAAV